MLADEAGRKIAAALTRRAIVLEGPGDLDGGCASSHGSGHARRPLSRLAALTREDIEGQRLLLHVDLSRATEDPGSGQGGASNGVGQELFPEAIRSLAEQVREILSAKPAAVAIVSEMAPPLDPPATAAASEASVQLSPPPALASEMRTAPSPVDEVLPTPSLRAIAAMVSSLLGMDVDFYESVPELAVALGRCGHVDGRPPSFGVKMMMAERLGAPGVVPAPPAEEPELSDGEEERLPDFAWGGEGVTISALLRFPHFAAHEVL